MLPEPGKKLREPIAALLLGAAVLYLITVLAELFDDEGTFGERAFFLQDRFVNPAWVLVPVAAALLVTLGGERTGRARIIVLGALAVLAVMALLGVISWLAGLGADFEFGFEGFGKITGSFLMIAGLAVLAAALWLVYSLFKSLPAPARQQAPQQGWAGQPQQPWGGGQPQQQWGGQPQQPWSGQPPAARPAGAPAGWAAPGSAHPPQPPASQPPAPQPPPAQSWGQQAPPQQQSWSQPGPQQAPGGPPAQPRGATAAPVAGGPAAPSRPGSEDDSTAVWSTPPAGESADPAPPRRESEDDSRPGWWNPGS